VPPRFKATIFPGDGIGPEIAKAVITIFEVSDTAAACLVVTVRTQLPRRCCRSHRVCQSAKVPVDWEFHTISTHAVTPGGDLISQEALDSVIRNKVGLKGALHRPHRAGEGVGGVHCEEPHRDTPPCPCRSLRYAHW